MTPVKPTLQTIADELGVSRSTVSNAYSRPDQLSPHLRDKILATARRLGYTGPHPGARSLRTGTVGAIGVLFTDDLRFAFTDPFAVQFLAGLAAAAQRHDTGLLLLPLSASNEETAASMVQSAVVDGFCSYCIPDWHAAWAAAEARDLPIVTGEHRDEGRLFVGIDEAAATRAAGEHLIRLGHRNIAVVSDWLIPERENHPVSLTDPDAVPYYVSRERLRGYAEAFGQAGVPFDDVITVNAAGNARADGAAAAAYALDREERPTAIVALTDLLALGVLDALTQRGLAPGRDVSVIGFDDIPDSATAGLTTVRQPAADRGRIAGELLLDPDSRPPTGQVVLPTELIVRASTGPVSSRR
ncbi:LacI family DNA-binding transcriptional regulator [Hamadaea sp. NPDC050747]|uniref:LacI family DNA-binding transcriptional regulator n=1 Tax=Hamadaea sp. NPDC050747 TaxID=3155789 RepID=UPI0033D09768